MQGMRAHRVQAYIAGKQPAKQRRQQAARHARSMGGDIPTSVVQGQQAARRKGKTQCRSTFGSTPAAASTHAQQQQHRATKGSSACSGETVRLRGERGGDTCMGGQRSSQSAFGSAPAAAPPQNLRIGPRGSRSMTWRGRGLEPPVAADSPAGPSFPLRLRYMLGGTTHPPAVAPIP